MGESLVETYTRIYCAAVAIISSWIKEWNKPHVFSLPKSQLQMEEKWKVCKTFCLVHKNVQNVYTKLWHHANEAGGELHASSPPLDFDRDLRWKKRYTKCFVRGSKMYAMCTSFEFKFANEVWGTCPIFSSPNFNYK